MERKKLSKKTRLEMEAGRRQVEKNRLIEHVHLMEYELERIVGRKWRVEAKVEWAHARHEYGKNSLVVVKLYNPWPSAKVEETLTFTERLGEFPSEKLKAQLMLLS